MGRSSSCMANAFPRKNREINIASARPRNIKIGLHRVFSWFAISFSGLGCLFLRKLRMVEYVLLILQKAQENCDNLGVKLMPALLLNILQYVLVGNCFAIDAVAGHGIPHIHNGKNARFDGNLFTPQPLRIPGSIPTFMMAVGDF